MKYIRLRIYVDNKNTEAVSLFLLDREYYEFSVEGIQVREDVLASKKVARWDFLDENKVEDGDIYTLYFDMQERKKVVSLEKELNEELSNKFVIKVESDVVDDEDWNHKWKENYKSKRIAENIIVKPSWGNLSEVDLKDGDSVIEMDPGMAFGTGTHETTSMCIELLEEYNCKDKDVLDVGTGSGILAIGAAMLGATKITAIDIDEDAVRVAKENIKNNNVESKITVLEGDLIKGLDLKADIVVANLISSLIIYLSDSLKQHMNEGGIFIASGILVEQMDSLISDMENRGFILKKAVEKNDWCALVFHME